MPKLTRSRSLYLSLSLSVLFFVACIVGLFLLPTLTEMLINTPDNIGGRDSITATGRALVLAVAYAILVTLLAADGCLFTILLRVKKRLVFTPVTVSLVDGVSWCCLLLCLFFGFLGVYFQLALIVSFLAAFLGLCLRVIKDTIAEATRLKDDNDLTV